MSGNTKLYGVLSDTYAELREFNRRVTARVDGSTSAMEQKYYSTLRSLVQDDMTYIDTMKEANAAGYLAEIADKLIACDVSVESDFMKLYVPVLMQYTVMTPIDDALRVCMNNLHELPRDYNFRRAASAIVDLQITREKPLFGMRFDVSSMCGAALIIRSADSDDLLTVRSFIEMHIYFTLSARGMLILGNFMDIKTVGMFLEAAQHSRDTIVTQHRDMLRSYEKMFHAALPNMQATRIAELTFAIEVAGNDTAIVARKLNSVQTKTAQRITELEAIVETNRIEASRQSSDNTIIAAIIVLIIVFAVSSFIH